MDNLKEDIDESTLRNLSVSGGFTVPFGYFNQNKKHILKQTVQQEIESLNVPVAYFEQSRAAILQKTIGSTTQPIHIVWYKKYSTYVAAASVLLVASILFWLMPTAVVPPANQLSDEEIIEYLNQSDLKDVPTVEMVSYTQHETTAAEAEQYLLNNTDNYLITEEL